MSTRIEPWSYDLDAAIYEAQRRWATTGRHHCLVQYHGGRIGIRPYTEHFRPAWSTHNTQRQLGATNNAGVKKLEPGDATLIRELRTDGMTFPAIADKFDVSVGAIKGIVYGRSWRDDRS